MVFQDVDLKDAYIIEMDRKEDKRGFFARSACVKRFDNQGIDFEIVQANVSYNHSRHTLRGLHFQKEPYSEAKLIRCIKGAIFDVIVDLRADSPTYMDWIGVDLKEDDYKMLYVPKGFAHGFLTLEDDSEVIYKVSEFYNPDAGFGIRWNDPALNIKWPAPPSIISDKDKSWPDFSGLTNTVNKIEEYEIS